MNNRIMTEAELEKRFDGLIVKLLRLERQRLKMAWKHSARATA